MALSFAKASSSLISHSPCMFIREGNGNPLQYSCLENPRDRGAWWAAIYGVAQSWTWLKWLSSSSSSSCCMFIFAAGISSQALQTCCMHLWLESAASSLREIPPWWHVRDVTDTLGANVFSFHCPPPSRQGWFLSTWVWNLGPTKILGY